MKVLSITRGSAEIARAHLRKPVLTIGRSPTCDVVMRAPGVAPIHFLIEWIGSGEFDPVNQDMWSIADISKPLKMTADGLTETAAEGVILSEQSVTLAGFQFKKIEDKLEAQPVIGGKIKGKLTKAPTFYGASVLADSVMEVVQIRTDSGAVEDVCHIMPARNTSARSVLEDIPEFKLQWDRGAGDKAVKVILSEMPGAIIFNRGQKTPVSGAYPVQSNDVLQVRWKEHDLFLRFVPRIDVPYVPREVLGDPLLRKLVAVALVLFGLLLGVSHLTKGQKELPKEPPRVATIEVKAETPPPPPPPPPAPVAPPPPETAPPKEVKAGLKDAATSKRPGQAAAPRYKADQPSKKLGLNAPSDVGNVNTIGILGAVKGSGSKGKGVRADMVINNGIITETVGSNSDASKIIVKNPPAGILGRGTGGGGGKGNGDGLQAAATTFAGGDKYNPGSAGPISRKGATGLGTDPGTGLGKGGSGVGAGSDIGSLDTGSFEVEGGLDRETVRRVIAAHRGQIRTCYEKALIATPGINGRVVYRWTISPTGPVVSVIVTQSTVGSKSLETCVFEVIRGMNFPAAPNGRPTTVIYPFEFQARK